jgi:hypothetical protein
MLSLTIIMIIIIIIGSGRSGDWSQDFVHGRQALYHWATT